MVYSLLRACRRRRPRLRWQNLIVSVCCCALSCALLSADLLHVACYSSISAAHRPLHLGSIMRVVPFISSAARRPLRVVRCTLSAARRPLHVVRCLWSGAWCLPHVVCCMSSARRFPLDGVLLHGACCTWSLAGSRHMSSAARRMFAFLFHRSPLSNAPHYARCTGTVHVASCHAWPLPVACRSDRRLQAF